MKLIWSSLVAVRALKLVNDLDYNKHQGSEDSYNPLVLASEAQGVRVLGFWLRQKIIAFNSKVDHLKDWFKIRRTEIGKY